jgi:hypothetical protein
VIGVLRGELGKERVTNGLPNRESRLLGLLSTFLLNEWLLFNSIFGGGTKREKKRQKDFFFSCYCVAEIQ